MLTVNVQQDGWSLCLPASNKTGKAHKHERYANHWQAWKRKSIKYCWACRGLALVFILRLITHSLFTATRKQVYTHTLTPAHGENAQGLQRCNERWVTAGEKLVLEVTHLADELLALVDVHPGLWTAGWCTVFVCWCLSVYCRKTVVCPIIDVISDDTFEYMAGSDMTYGGFNWKLNFRWYPVPQREMDRRKGDRTLPVRWVVHTARWVFKFHCYYPFHTYKTDWQQFLCFKLSLFILPKDIYDPGLVLT